MMSRVKIDLPEQFLFQTEVPIYFGHINAGGHMDHSQVLVLVSEARMRFVRSLGYLGWNLDGFAMVVADCALQYRSQAFYGETLTIELMPKDFNKYGFSLYFKLSDRGSRREIARGKTGIVFVDPVSQRPVAVSESLLAKFAGNLKAPAPVCSPELVEI